MAGKKNEHGATGATVAENIARLRTDSRLGYAELSRRLEEVTGRSIPPLGLRRIEEGERRVDVDDIVALAIALNVSPNALLMPLSRTANARVKMTGVESVSALNAWHFLEGMRPLRDGRGTDFILGSLPQFITIDSPSTRLLLGRQGNQAERAEPFLISKQSESDGHETNWAIGVGTQSIFYREGDDDGDD